MRVFVPYCRIRTNHCLVAGWTSACVQVASIHFKEFNWELHQVIAGKEPSPAWGQRPAEPWAVVAPGWGNRGFFAPLLRLVRCSSTSHSLSPAQGPLQTHRHLGLLHSPALLPCPAQGPWSLQRKKGHTLFWPTVKKLPFLFVFYPCPAHNCRSLGTARAHVCFFGSRKLLLCCLLWFR